MKNKTYPLYSLPEIRDLKDMVKRRAQNTPDETAFSYSAGKNKVVRKTCSEFSSDIDALGTFLYEKGFRNAHIAIIGENSYEWIVAFLAIVNGGNVAVPIDKEQPAERVAQMLVQSDCKAVFVSKSYADLVDENSDVTVFSLSEFQQYISEGQKLINSGKMEYINYSIDADKLVAIFFTSGTTGNGKGVMLSHKNMVADINSACKNFRLDGDTLAVLPFHHTFGLITAIFKVFNYQHSAFINKGLRYIQKDLQTVKPQTVFFVPLFVETFYKTIMETARKSGKEKTLICAAKLSNILLKLGIDLRKKLFKSVHAAFGGNLEYVICGGAPLDAKYVKAFRSWGVNILNGYGITECSPVVSVNRNFYWRDGSVGQVLDGCQVKIADDGEILVKGDNVMMGYYKDDISSKEVLTDGWYSTGDLGHIDKDGFLFITGRKKNLIILSNGENVSPEEIEAKILLDDAVAEVVVYGENGMLSAEIFPNEAYFDNNKYFDDLIAELNKEQPQFKQIRKVRLRDKEFEKNSTKKILRYKVMEEHHD
ncbi:MAG: AMP-dependent synthetase/ligase [Porcipelethomonas sp.]